MSQAMPLSPSLRAEHYLTQTGRKKLTARQRRRWWKKAHKSGVDHDVLGEAADRG